MQIYLEDELDELFPVLQPSVQFREYAEILEEPGFFILGTFVIIRVGKRFHILLICLVCTVSIYHTLQLSP